MCFSVIYFCCFIILYRRNGHRVAFMCIELTVGFAVANKYCKILNTHLRIVHVHNLCQILH